MLMLESGGAQPHKAETFSFSGGEGDHVKFCRTRQNFFDNPQTCNSFIFVTAKPLSISKEASSLMSRMGPNDALRSP